MSPTEKRLSKSVSKQSEPHEQPRSRKKKNLRAHHLARCAALPPEEILLLPEVDVVPTRTRPILSPPVLSPLTSPRAVSSPLPSSSSPSATTPTTEAPAPRKEFASGTGAIRPTTSFAAAAGRNKADEAPVESQGEAESGSVDQLTEKVADVSV